MFRLLASGKTVTEGMDGLDDPATTGFRMRFGWSDLEKVEGKPDFSVIINSAKIAAAHGKKVSVGIVLVAAAPAFVTAKCEKLTSDVGVIPKPWDANFEKAADAFTAAEGAALDSIPNLVYVTIGGLGAIMETRLEVATLSAADDTAWRKSSKHRIDTFATGFKSTPFVIAYANVYRQGGDAATQEVASYGFATYPKRFGIMQCGWKVSSGLGYYPDQAMHDHAGTNIGGLQQVGWDDTRNEGTLAQQITTALQFNPWFLEIYLPYFTTANQPLLLDTIPKLRSAYGQ